MDNYRALTTFYRGVAGSTLIRTTPLHCHQRSPIREIRLATRFLTNRSAPYLPLSSRDDFAMDCRLPLLGMKCPSLSIMYWIKKLSKCCSTTNFPVYAASLQLVPAYNEFHPLRFAFCHMIEVLCWKTYINKGTKKNSSNFSTTAADVEVTTEKRINRNAACLRKMIKECVTQLQSCNECKAKF
uniref:Uncharacterized protein n=2 Tax=Parascaris univalens TaxID=6257 RepID=A0A915AJH5_PARUN